MNKTVNVGILKGIAAIICGCTILPMIHMYAQCENQSQDKQLDFKSTIRRNKLSNGIQAIRINIHDIDNKSGRFIAIGYKIDDNIVGLLKRTNHNIQPDKIIINRNMIYMIYNLRTANSIEHIAIEEKNRMLGMSDFDLGMRDLQGVSKDIETSIRNQAKVSFCPQNACIIYTPAIDDDKIQQIFGTVNTDSDAINKAQSGSTNNADNANELCISSYSASKNRFICTKKADHVDKKDTKQHGDSTSQSQESVLIGYDIDHMQIQQVFKAFLLSFLLNDCDAQFESKVDVEDHKLYLKYTLECTANCSDTSSNKTLTSKLVSDAFNNIEIKQEQLNDAKAKLKNMLGKMRPSELLLLTMMIAGNDYDALFDQDGNNKFEAIIDKLTVEDVKEFQRKFSFDHSQCQTNIDHTFAHNHMFDLENKIKRLEAFDSDFFNVWF